MIVTFFWSGSLRVSPHSAETINWKYHWNPLTYSVNDLTKFSMVKSYKGIKVQKEATLPAVLVKDYMATKLITFSPDESIFKVMDTLMKNKISGGPVVNEDHQLVGMISEGDCLKEVVRGKYHNMPTSSGKVSDYMASEVVTIAPEANVFEVAQMFLNKRLRRFPVVRDGKLVGQISQKDVMKAVRQLNSSSWR